MKNITHTILPLLVFIGIAFSCKEEVKEKKQEGYVVTGSVKGLQEATIKLYEFNFADRGAAPKVIDSVQMTNGTFEFKGKIEHPDRVSIWLGKKFNSEFFLENSIISLNFDTAESDRGRLIAKVSGSELGEIYDEQQNKIDSIMNQPKFLVLKEIRTKMTKAYNSKDDAKIKAFKEWRAQYSDLEDERIKEQKTFKIQYAKNNPESPVAPWVLGFQFSESRMSKEEMKEIYPIFKGAAKQTAMFKYYEKTYDDIFNSLGEGSTAPDFKLNDVNGNEIALSKVTAKYKLVDFWASWCVPCRASFPHLKELYKKYKKDGFEVVGIGTADEEAKWRQAIEKDQITWIHLYDPSANHQWGVVARLYGVPFLPTTFLMDENEKIILRNPSKEQLDVKLKELFGH
ncbi:AhpC/TSA family protein [Lutibacter sp. A80]|uniref:TlpA disulfide reductase family protein n=1 Tax=Lutibacter sp. A80 TaxID=2918453 RepID=UPI001F067014|nr:TlpA disulfide reductase family protein [Lutibacter sp. A80]UMB60840.1 AhpC/TSA family protein [Lutibacter sp. A80]